LAGFLVEIQKAKKGGKSWFICHPKREGFGGARMATLLSKVRLTGAFPFPYDVQNCN
jgi:hypothetical protein